MTKKKQKIVLKGKIKGIKDNNHIESKAKRSQRIEIELEEVYSGILELINKNVEISTSIGANQ